MQKILPIELAKAILNKESGLFVFLSENNESIRIVLRNGEIVEVYGLYGEGEAEIGRLFLWGTGNVIKKELPKEYKDYVPKKKYQLNGFLKILVESSKKETKKEKIELSMYELVFNVYSDYMESERDFIHYPKEEWLGVSSLIKKISKFIANSLIYIPRKYIIFIHNNEIDFAVSKEGYVKFEKIDEENLFEQFEYKVVIVTPEEYEIATLPFTKRPDYEGDFNNVNLDDYKLGVIYNQENAVLYAKNITKLPNVRGYYKCILWK